MKKAVVYARYSCDNQTEQSIEGQLRVCNEYAEKHNLLIVENYIDRAMTGRNDNRPDFKRMLADSDKKSFECVLVYKFDRFSRNKYESVIHKKYLRDKGITVISAMENIPDTPEGIILESLLEGLNQYYSAELSQKVKRGMRETRLKGLYQGGHRPFGYNIVNRKLEINKKEAKLVKYIFQEYSLGVNGKDIADAIIKKGAKYRERKFKHKDVYRILDKEYYSGIYVCQDESFCTIYPPIISRKLYQEAELMRKYNRNGGSSKELFLFRYKLFCKKCGERYASAGGTSNTGKVKRYYKCFSKKHSDCESQTYRKHELEDFLMSALMNFFNNSLNIDLLAENLMRRYKKKKNLDFIKSCEAEKAVYIKSLNQLYKSVDIEESSVVNSKIRLLENKISALESEITIEKGKEARRHSLSFIKSFYAEALSLNDIKFVQQLVTKIMLDDNEIDIYLENPYGDKFKTYENIKSFVLEKTYKVGKSQKILEKNINIIL